MEKHSPTCEEMERYIRKWDELEDYVNQEKALDKLFMQMCKENQCIEDILIKCSALNDFYSTNIFKVHHVAQHYLKQNIDQRLKDGEIEPLRCEVCDYCADTEVLDGPISMDMLMGEI